MEGEKRPFKIWRNPSLEGQSPKYMGEAYALEGHLYLRADDLRALGFSPGHYTVRVPEALVFLYDLPRWERLQVDP